MTQMNFEAYCRSKNLRAAFNRRETEPIQHPITRASIGADIKLRTSSSELKKSAVSTRYEKLASRYLDLVTLAAICDWLR